MPDNQPFIVAAYSVTWVAIIAYGVYLRRARQAAEQRLATAKRSAGGTA